MVDFFVFGHHRASTLEVFPVPGFSVTSALR